MDKKIEEIIQRIKKFRDERDWMQFHDHKSMAVSLVLEAAEVLEHFQWKSKEETAKYGKEKKEEIGEELADVAIYLIEMADNLGIDLTEAIGKKMDKNEKKYPVEKAKGRHNKYNDL
ncbi:MAG: nucleotide pyrophosphohydrolase [Caldisericia bacterium]|nr:nucleotide pyrophosphohydrolase [Caldisericia bacterium]